MSGKLHILIVDEGSRMAKAVQDIFGAVVNLVELAEGVSQVLE